MSETPPSLSIDIAPAVSGGVYANMVISSLSFDEVTLDFLYLLPHLQKATVQSRVILNPRQAKRLATLLASTINDYESQFGMIQDEPLAPGIQLSPN